MDHVFKQNGITTFIDVAIVTTFTSSPGLTTAASARLVTWPREPRKSNLIAGRPANKFISTLMKDAELTAAATFSHIHTSHSHLAAPHSLCAQFPCLMVCSGKPLLRWFSALGADRNVQFCDWFVASTPALRQPGSCLAAEFVAGADSTGQSGTPVTTTDAMATSLPLPRKKSHF